jgi:hypothetical protein
LSATDGDSAKTCFVAMPITTSAWYVEKLGDPDHFVHVLDHLFTPALRAAGLTVIPPSVSGPEMIHAEIIKNLEQADFVLCDLSDHNPNVFFELGIRTSLDRPVILVKDDLTSRIPFDINAINTGTYGSSLTPWSLATEIPRLTSLVQAAIGSGNPGNAMWHYFGLTKRGAPSDPGANPVDAKLNLILRELAKRDQSSNQVSDRQLGEDLNSREVWELLSPIMRQFIDGRFGLTGIRNRSGKRSVEILLPDPNASPSGLRVALINRLDDAGLSDVRILFDYLPEDEDEAHGES